jgi:Ethanolamine utilization protein EutJ (predicted chaperonin)
MSRYTTGRVALRGIGLPTTYDPALTLVLTGDIVVDLASIEEYKRATKEKDRG